MFYRVRSWIFMLGVGTFSCFSIAQPSSKKGVSFSTYEQKKVVASIDQHAALYAEKAKQIWDFAEVGFQEYKSAALLQEMLEAEGFTIEKGVAGIPTAFVATFGQGYPTIGVLGEYDALPGISQDAVAERKVLENKDAGHACGHHLFGVASAAAAIEAKRWLMAHPLSGTIKFFGCPAEEGGSGKVYMVREGLFDKVDAVLHWHPSGFNAVDKPASLANISAKFRFRGLSSHASASPEKGRSALDGVEAMDYMANLMREHMPSTARMHYVITNGGKAPNVVPDFAEVYYYVRHEDPEVARALFERLVQASQGAAQGTGTSVEHEIIGGVYNMLPNVALAEVMYKHLKFVGAYALDEKETAFAQKIYETLGRKKPFTSGIYIDSFWASRPAVASTDVSDVSWNVPTVGLRTATWVQFTPAHSWQAIACGGMSIGMKGMQMAIKTLGLTVLDLIIHPPYVERAKREFEQRRGKEFIYKPLLGDRKPALDYRK